VRGSSLHGSLPRVFAPVIYQIYPRSYADANGDGNGDLPGITARLDHLAWLGVDAVWLSPTFPSPNVDWGYDVADYTAVHPDFGTLADLDLLITEAAQRGIRILLDLVPNHTSNRHRWFAEHPDYYVWRDEIPNRWTSVFSGGPAWRFDETRRQYYLHQFAVEQPDLDWWNPAVHDEFERILRFWFERGVGGFRIDVAHSVVKDKDLRDPQARYSRNQPEVHAIYRRWQEIAQEYDPKPILMGETYVDLRDMVTYYGSGIDELDLAQNFDFLRAPFVAERLRAIVEETERRLPPGAVPCYFCSNHDHSRLASRWAGGDERKARAALFVLLTLRGTPILFQGDELALEDGVVPPERITDVADPPRDAERTPMPWTAAGDEWQDPWLPLGDTTRNVEDQRADPASTLSYVRDLIGQRKAFADASYRSLESPPGVWAYERGDVTCVVNMTGGGARYAGRTLEPWQGLIL
jgi:alpha-glucosidase